MEMTILLTEAETYTRNKMESDASGHDWWHTDRVRKTALNLAREESADPFVCELAALLHDVWDPKLTGQGHEWGLLELEKWLIAHGADENTVFHVKEIVQDLSFKGADVATPMRTIEGKVVQDADRLDALGAIGIARTFAYGGAKGRAIYDPAVSPVLHPDFHSYHSSNAPTLNHFYEKLLLLKDRMNTRSARRMAEHRHAFMETYLKEFYQEWDGK